MPLAWALEDLYMQLLARSSAQTYDQDCAGSSINAPPLWSSAFSSVLGFYFHCCSCSWSWEQHCWCYLSFLLAGVQVAGSGGSSIPLPDSSAPTRLLNTYLEQGCLHFLAQGLAPSTQKDYASTQVPQILLPSWKAPLQWLNVPCRWVDFMFVCFISCRFDSALFN